MPAVEESHVALVAALRKLPVAQRQALVLYHIADLRAYQIAVEVGVAEGAIRASAAQSSPAGQT